MTFTAKRRVAYFYDAEVGNYYYSQGHPMKPHRMRMTHNLLLSYGLLDKMDVFVSPRATHREMTRFHSDEYINFLNSISPDTLPDYTTSLCRFNVLEDCPVFDGLWEYCQIAAGGSLAGAARLNAGDSSVAINWAGGLHHAKRAEASGFCYINDCVLAILELLKIHARVLYVDIDIHHGDGVEEAFYTTDRVMTASFHKYGDYFPGTGDVSDIGISRGKYYSANFPLRDGIDDDSYREIFVPVMSRIMEWYQPGVVVLQCGADSLSGDRLGCFNLSLMGHAQCVDFFKRYDVPLLLLGGGGYTIRNVARCWAYETSRVVGETLADELPFNENFEFYGPEFRLHIVPSNMENHNSPSELHKTKVKIFEHLRHLPHAPSPPMIDTPRNSLIPMHRLENDGHTSAIATIDDDDDPDVRKRRRRAKTVVDYTGSDEEDDDQYISSLRCVKRKNKRTNFPRRRYPTAVLSGAVPGSVAHHTGKSAREQDVELSANQETSFSPEKPGNVEKSVADDRCRVLGGSTRPETQKTSPQKLHLDFSRSRRIVDNSDSEKTSNPGNYGSRRKDGIETKNSQHPKPGADESDGSNFGQVDGGYSQQVSYVRKKLPKLSNEGTGSRKSRIEGGLVRINDARRHTSGNSSAKKQTPPSSPRNWIGSSGSLEERLHPQRHVRLQEDEDGKQRNDATVRKTGRGYQADGKDSERQSGLQYQAHPNRGKGQHTPSGTEHGNRAPVSNVSLERFRENNRVSLTNSASEPGGEPCNDEGTVLEKMGRTEFQRLKRRPRENIIKTSINNSESLIDRAESEFQSRVQDEGSQREKRKSGDAEMGGNNPRLITLDRLPVRRGKGEAIAESSWTDDKRKDSARESETNGSKHKLAGVDGTKGEDGDMDTVGSKGDRNKDGSKAGRQKVRSVPDVSSEDKSDRSVQERAVKESEITGKVQGGESEKSEESVARDGEGFPREVEEEDMTPSEDSREHRAGWSDGGGTDVRGRLQSGNVRAETEHQSNASTREADGKAVADDANSPSLRDTRDR